MAGQIVQNGSRLIRRVRIIIAKHHRTFAPSVRPEPVEGHSSEKIGVRQAHPERFLNPKRKS